MTSYPDDTDRQTTGPTTQRGGSREEQLTRLDQLERDIAVERERLNRPDVDARDESGTSASHRQQESADTVREVDLPDLETKVTESQRAAWELGYQAGVSDAQSGGGDRTANPFHPLRENRI